MLWLNKFGHKWFGTTKGFKHFTKHNQPLYRFDYLDSSYNKANNQQEEQNRL